MTPEQLAKLPSYARAHIRKQEQCIRALEEDKGRALLGFGEPRVFAKTGTRMETRTPIGGTMTALVFVLTEGCEVEALLREDRLCISAGSPHNRLAVFPDASNLIHVEPVS